MPEGNETDLEIAFRNLPMVVHIFLPPCDKPEFYYLKKSNESKAFYHMDPLGVYFILFYYSTYDFLMARREERAEGR